MPSQEECWGASSESQQAWGPDMGRLKPGHALTFQSGPQLPGLREHQTMTAAAAVLWPWEGHQAPLDWRPVWALLLRHKEAGVPAPSGPWLLPC